MVPWNLTSVLKRPCKLICDIPNLQHLISPLLYSPCLPCIKWSMLSSFVPASERLRRVQRQFCTSLVLAWLRWIERACKFEKLKKQMKNINFRSIKSSKKSILVILFFLILLLCEKDNTVKMSPNLWSGMFSKKIRR